MDTLRSGIRTGSLAPCRAGGFAGNHLIHSSFIPAKSVSSKSMTVALTVRSSEVPAASRIAATFLKHCRVCSWIEFPTIFPVIGSWGPVPDTNTRPAARTAWLYMGGGDGAFVVRIISRVKGISGGGCKSHFANSNTRCNGSQETERSMGNYCYWQSMGDLGIRIGLCYCCCCCCCICCRSMKGIGGGAGGCWARSTRTLQSSGMCIFRSRAGAVSLASTWTAT